MPSSHLILCYPLLLLPPIPPSIRVFSYESTLPMRWPKYWSFSFSINPSNEHPGLISFRMDWLDLFAVQGTLKSLLQHHTSKASILQRSTFFTVQLSHLYMTSGKTIALTRQTFAVKVMSQLFNMLSRLVITFLQRSKHLLISWLQSLSVVILEPKKNQVWHCFHSFPIYFHEVMGPDAMILVFWMLSFKSILYTLKSQKRKKKTLKWFRKAPSWGLISSNSISEDYPLIPSSLPTQPYLPPLSSLYRLCIAQHRTSTQVVILHISVGTSQVAQW